ncbi:MAG: gliding motility-associated C-terminal domain-containing protein [Vicingaceae bacterium]|nr:gliding motility-associated C-terminal domain-containing protein [Vicingaceae bacterium]
MKATTSITLTKIFFLSLACGLFPPFGGIEGGCQNNSLVLDGAYIVLDGGTAANSIHIVVDQPNPLGIVRLPAGGHIHSENQYNFITWLTAASTGSYLFPFGVGGNATDYIPFTFNKTAGNNNVSISTWFTNPQNFPKPAATNVGPVTNMAGITDSVVYAIDRFWDIQAPGATADLTFSYRGIENTTTNPTNLVQAQHWNGTTWDTPVGPGTAGVTIGIGTAGVFNGQNTFSPWVLITTCTTDTLTQNPVICQGSSITVGTNTYTTTGTFIDTLTNILGCDSIITTNLTVNPTATSTDVQTACDSLTWIDGITYSASTTTPTFTLTGGAANGCDSIVTLNLTINPFASGTDIQTACNTFTWLDNIVYTTSTNTPTFTFVGGSVSGCDSIVTLNLTINPTATSTDIQTACNTFTWIDGITYSTSTTTPTFTIVGGSVQGCDSIVTLNLTINSATTGTDVITSCTPITWIDGITYSTSTTTPTFTIVGGSVQGCDSIVTLNLTINSATTGTDVITSCTSITWIDGITYSTSTTTPTFTIVGGSVQGCDSIVTLNLTINSAATFTDIQTICGNSFTWIDGINYSANTNTPTVTFIGGAANGCDSIITLNLTLTIPNKTTTVIVECDGFSVTVGTNTYTTTGVFTDIINNCDTIITDLTINPAPQLTLIKADDNCGENNGSIEAEVTTLNTPIVYNWSNGSSDSIINNLAAGTYTLIVQDNAGCTTTGEAIINETNIACDFFVYTPNMFSPNGDGENDVFFVRGKGIATLSVKIYNRWGNKVFEINDVNQGWDGTYKGANQNTAVFVYVLEATFLNGKTVTESGDVSLIR